MRNLIFVATVALLVLAGLKAVCAEEFTTNITTDPSKALFVYDDVVNFIRVAQMLNGTSDTLTILQEEYLDRGTDGLKKFIEKYDLTAERMLRAIRLHPEKYASLAEHPPAIEKLAVDGRAAYARLKEYIPNAIFPPTYFLVGAYRGIGSGSSEGTLITVEKWKLPVEGKTTLLVHELTHIQQVVAVGYDNYIALYGPKKSLLGLCIREGTAEFFAELVTGNITQSEAVKFTRENEERLWHQFVKEMHGSETGDWMWSTPADSTQPMHVGYVLGSFIIRAFYDNAENKAQAAVEILGVTDYNAFLEKSGYALRFGH